MQFKSIIAVLALSVAVAAIPVEPVAVELVRRTTPSPTPTPPSTGQQCKVNQVLISNCIVNGIPLTSTNLASALVALVQIPLSILIPITCVGKSLQHMHFLRLAKITSVNGLNIGSNQAACCELKQGAPTNVRVFNLIRFSC